MLLIPVPGDHQLMCPAPFIVSLPIVPGPGVTRHQSAVELQTKVKRRFAKVSLVSYSRPSLMIVGVGVPISHLYLTWGQRPFSIVS